MHGTDLARYCTAVEMTALTGTRDRAEQRAACKALGIRYSQRWIAHPSGRGGYHVDECEVWIDADVRAMLDRTEIVLAAA